MQNLNTVDTDLLKASLDAMNELVEAGGGEQAHIEADELLCEVLTKLGYGELVASFNRLRKWYS